jgi:hypothetical protein
VSLFRLVVLLTLVLFVAAGCHDDSSRGLQRKPSRRSGEPLPTPAGSLAGARWPAGTIRAGMLLHDDGRRLWSVPLSGGPRIVWAHRKVHVYEIAAAPNGGSLAYVVNMFPASPSATEVMAYLYLLRSDGRVELVDEVKNYRSIESPVFLRPPSAPGNAVRLYWYRGSEELAPGTQHLDNDVMVLDRGRVRWVHVALRRNEAPIDIEGYPGSANLTVTTFRHDDLPTRGEVLRLEQSPDLRSWAEFGSAANTDELNGVAWISRNEYVVHVTQRFYPARTACGCTWSGASTTARI